MLLLLPLVIAFVILVCVLLLFVCSIGYHALIYPLAVRSYGCPDGYSGCAFGSDLDTGGCEALENSNLIACGSLRSDGSDLTVEFLGVTLSVAS